MFLWIRSNWPIAATLVVVALLLSASYAANSDLGERLQNDVTTLGERAATSHPAIPQDAKTNSRELGSNEALWSWHRFLFEITVADALIALFTVVLAFATILLWKATNKLGKRADSSTRQLERAYIFFGIKLNDGELPPHPDGLPPNHLAGIFFAENLGKTPGFIKEFYVRSLPVTPIEGEPNYPTSNQYRRVFYASQPVAKEGEQKLARAALDSMEDTLLYGYVKYTDIFKEEHISRFCLILRAEALRETRPIIYYDLHGPAAWNAWD